VASFHEILTGTAEDLVKVFYIYEQDNGKKETGIFPE